MPDALPTVIGKKEGRAWKEQHGGKLIVEGTWKCKEKAKSKDAKATAKEPSRKHHTNA